MNHPDDRSTKRHLGALCILVGLFASACGKHSASDGTEAPPEPIKECEAFVASLQHCLERLGPSDIAAARVAQARASLDAQLSHSPRDAVRKQCITSLTNMTCR